MLKTYHGSCHCKAVTFEADIDLAEGTGRCNCSICQKRRNWSITVKPDAFRLLSGADSLTDYQFASLSAHHRFCKVCGVATHGDGDIPEIGGAYVSVKLTALDDISDIELAEAPIRFYNGRDNDWWHEPAETRHL